MKRKLFNILMIVALLTGLLATLPVAAKPPAEDMAAAEPTSTVASVARKAPIAIGAIPPAGTRYTPQHPALVEFKLREKGAIALDATPEQVEAAVSEYYDEFYKKSSAWVNPKIKEWALDREAEMTRLHKSKAPAEALAIQPVTATVLAMAVDFGATEVFSDPCSITQTVIITGPLHGEMPPPGPNDNQTIWYSPQQTADPSFYANLIFGYEGAGRTRLDLTDPHDGQPGINLTGLTVQDYYDHVAGPGNVVVTGSVEGWVTVPHSESYYGAPLGCGTSYDDSGGVVPVAMLVVDALDVFSATYPAYYTDTGPDAFWPKYDGNNDGLVDTYWIIHAGFDSQTSGNQFDIASHSSDLRFNAGWEDGYKVYEGDVLTTTDDIYVGPYTMQPENLDLGVLCEEFGHNFFGLPDMYVFDLFGNSIAAWNIMSAGVWNGYLGGSQPAGMPLWFRMIAACGEDVNGDPIPCNWQEPMVERVYNEPMADVTIGQLEMTPPGVNRGIRINLPSYTEVIDNLAGGGIGAFSGAGRDETDAMLSRQIAVGATAIGTLTIDAYWDIEDDWDYGYVMVNGAIVRDMDDVFTDYNPNGNNLGWGLTGHGEGTLRFDLSAYAGQTVELTLRYRTDAAVTYDGWWVDNIALDGTLIEDFETAAAPDTFPPEWTNTDPGWLVVPQTGTYDRYYLVEWRARTKYDISVESRYVTTGFSLLPDGTIEWHVERMPYNIPGALLYYRDTKYSATYAQSANYFDPPSVGPKYQLLIVDMNPMPLRLGDTPETNVGYFGTSLSSYDAALTLQPSAEFTITNFNGMTYTYPSKPAVTNFNDAQGYYAGYLWGEPCGFCNHDANNYESSAVIPARGPYTVRMTDFYGNRLGPEDEWLYSYPWGPSTFGSGNPGDDNVQFGIRFDLAGKAGDDAYNSTATLHFRDNTVMDITTTPDTTLVTDPGDYTVTYETVLENNGAAIIPNVAVTFTLDNDLEFVSLTPGTSSPVRAPATVHGWHGTLGVGERVTVTLVAAGTAELGMHETLRTQVDASDGEPRGPWFYDTRLDVGFTLLHTNDFHGRVDGYDRGGGACDPDYPEYCIAGSARLTTMIDEIRSTNPNVLLLDAGDQFQGSLFYNLFKADIVTFTMNYLGYDAMVIGNHEFDDGPAGLAPLADGANFPILGTNVDVSAEPLLAGKIATSTVLSRMGGDVGIIGLTTPETSFLASPGPNVVFDDPVASAQAAVDALEAQGINKIVALTHQGYAADLDLAQNVSGIDVIVGGHSHTFIYTPTDPIYFDPPQFPSYSPLVPAGPYPTEVTAPDGNPVLVVTAYQWGTFLGNLDVSFDDNGVVNAYGGNPIYMGTNITKEVTLDYIISTTYRSEVMALMNTIIGTSTVDIPIYVGADRVCRLGECLMGNLVADAMLWRINSIDPEDQYDIAITNGGGLRAPIDVGPISVGEVMEDLPFGNTIATFKLTGQHLIEALENGVSQVEYQAGRFPQVSGMRYTWSPALAPGSRILAVEVLENGRYVPLDPDAVYKIATNNYMRTGGDGYTVFDDFAIDPYDFGPALDEALIDYIQAQPNATISPQIEGRITQMDKVVTILHTNDTHGVWEETYYYGTPEGFAFLATLIEQERAANPNTLLLDAGDTFQGNAFAQYFRNADPNPIAGGMNLLDYDAMVLGNHEFNFGSQTFQTMLGQVDFPLLGSANLDDDGRYGLANVGVQDYVTLSVDGVDIAIFGLTNPRVYRYELPTNIEGLTFYPATSTAQSLVPQILAGEEPDLLIGLTHIGYSPYGDELDSDLLVAQQVPGIDVIVGGHSHTVLDPAVMVTSTINPTGTLIGQTGRYAQYLGKINIGFTGNMTDGYQIAGRWGHLIPVGEASVHPTMTQYLQPFLAELDAYTGQEIAVTTVPIDALEAYTEETNGANQQVDAAAWLLAENGINVDFHLSGAMSNRRVADGATVTNPITLTIDDMYTLMPYENSLVAFELNGAQLKYILERSYRNYWYYMLGYPYGGYSHYTTCFLDISQGGQIFYKYTPEVTPTLTSDNVIGVKLDGEWLDLTENTTYTVSSVNYVAAGSCNFNDEGETIWPLDQIVADTQFYVRDAVIAYLQAQTEPIAPAIEGRLQFLAGEPDLSTSTKTVEDADGDGEAEAGEVLTYTITIANTGDYGAGLVLTDVLPAGLTFVDGSLSVSSPGDVVTASVTGNVLTAHTPDYLQPTTGGSLVGVATIVFAAQVSDPAPDATHITNTVELQDQLRSYMLEAVIPVVSVGVPPTAGFTASATDVVVGEAINFTNTSTGTLPLTYLWEFGDGVTSTLESPTHAYAITGTFTVTLTVTNAYGEDQATDVITVSTPVYNLLLPVVMKNHS